MTRPRLKIAVCGHRHLHDPNHFETGIQFAIRRIQQAYPEHSYQVFSCLAEGADRLLAKRFIEVLDADLTVVLPLPERDYLKDFQSGDSIREYKDLTLLSKEVVPAGRGQIRPQAYQAANHYLVENCDLLVAIWDGLPARGPGGTAEVVQIARQIGQPLLWIHAGVGMTENTLTVERLEPIY
jgi:hypothetical protein